MGFIPGKHTPGSINSEMICQTDLMATIAALVEYPLPDNASEDSFNILPLLLGEKPGRPIRDHIIHHSGNGTFAIREGDWKLIVGNLGSGGFTKPERIPPEPNGPQGQLYNLGDDPREKINLYESRPVIVKRLTELLSKYRQQGRSRP